MPAERLPMRKVREVLRLKHACGVSERVIARSLGDRPHDGRGISPSCGGDRDHLADPRRPRRAALERRLFTPAGFMAADAKPLPDWSRMHAELRRRGVTLLLLWEEYRAEHPDGYGYSRFCDSTARGGGVTATMRQTHVAGEKLFVDFAGDTVPVVDGLSGEVARRQDLRRGARRVELHVRAGALERGARRLDRRPRRRARLSRRRAEGWSSATT